MEVRKPQLDALTGIRFPFAVLVVVNHVAILCYVARNHPGGGGPEWAEWAENAWQFFNSSWVARGLIQGACVGLSLFFTLSGFILTYIYDTGPENRPLDKREFFVARVARIYPLYLAALVFSMPIFLVVVASHEPALSMEKVVAMGASAILLLQAWWPEASTIWNPPGWSLSVEAFFYLLFPIMIRLFHGWSRTRLIGMILVCWVWSWIAPLTYWLFDPDGLGPTDWASEGPWFVFVKHNPLVRVPEFLVGVVLGKLYLRRPEWSEAEEGRIGALLSVGALVVILAVMSVAESLNYLLLHNGLTSPLFCIMIYGLALGGGPLVWAMSRPLGVLLGDGTYALYSLHSGVIAYSVVATIVTKNFSQSPLTFLLSCLISSILLSIPCYRKFEMPARRLVRKWLMPRRAPRVAVPALGQTSPSAPTPSDRPVS